MHVLPHAGLLCLLAAGPESFHALQGNPQQDAIDRAMSLLRCLAECDEARSGLSPEIDFLGECGIGFWDAPEGVGGMAEPETTTEVEIEDPDDPNETITVNEGTWTEGTPNPLWFVNDFGAGGTHWDGDYFGNGAAADLALASITVHASSHALNDNYSGSFEVDPPYFPTPEDEIAWHQAEVRASMAQQLILSSIFTPCGDDCLYMQGNRPLTDDERAAIEDYMDIVEVYAQEHSDLEEVQA